MGILLLMGSRDEVIFLLDFAVDCGCQLLFKMVIHIPVLWTLG